jgi:KEOPS complex subunit Pcc1
VHTTALSFAYDDDSIATRVAASVRPEVGDIDGDRTRATLERDGDAVEVHLEADDLVALRAGVNTWCTLVEVADEASGAVE